MPGCGIGPCQAPPRCPTGLIHSLGLSFREPANRVSLPQPVQERLQIRLLLRHVPAPGSRTHRGCSGSGGVAMACRGRESALPPGSQSKVVASAPFACRCCCLARSWPGSHVPGRTCLVAHRQSNDQSLPGQKCRQLISLDTVGDIGRRDDVRARLGDGPGAGVNLSLGSKLPDQGW